MEGQKIVLNRRAFVAGGAVAAASLGLGLAGCGGGSTEETAASSSAGSNAGTEAAAGSLTAAVGYQTNNYHPSTTSSALALGANWHVVEGLYELNMSTYEPHAALAAGDPVEVSETVYEVTLREGAKFSDGTAVTAADVVSSWKRATAEGGLYVPMLSWIANMEAKDDTTVTITTAFPFSLVKERLSLIKVVPTNATDDELTSKPVGTGPWMYESISEQQITFAPNPEYNGDYPAGNESMVWDIIVDDTARCTAIQEGSVLCMENVPADMIDQIAAGGAATEDVQGFNLPFLMFNTKKAPFDDARVRQAFFYAINVDQLISNAMMDKAVAAKSFLPETHANYHEASTVYTYDTAKATELLTEAGVSNLSITLDTTDANWITSLSPQIKNDLEATGLITVEIREQASSSLYANQTDTDDPQFDVVLAPGDPSVFGNDPDLLMNWWYGDNTWTQKRTQWKGSEAYEQLQTLMNQAVQATGDEQQEIWNQCFDLIAQEVPLYPLFHRSVTTAYYADQLDGYEPIGTTGLNFIGVTAK